MVGGSTHADERRELLIEQMALVAEGNRDALRSVYEMTSAKLLGIILRILPERDVAEDVLQEVFFKVWRRAGRYDRTVASPITWLAVIARNAAIDELRRRKPHVASEGDTALAELADGTQPVDERLCDEQSYEAIRRCLDELAGDQRKSIRLAYFGGLTHTQLAERAEVPLGTMKSWIRRGLQSLKGCLGHG